MVKKYTDKHAVRIVREEDKQDLIAFFEAIKSDCNDLCWESPHIEIGEIWFIDNYGGLACFDPIDDLSDYIILEGVPEDWREVMEAESKKSIPKIMTINRQMERALMGENPNLGEKTSISNQDPYELINQLESKKKELEECLELGIDLISEWCKTFPEIAEDEDKRFLTQAKQLLNK